MAEEDNTPPSAEEIRAAAAEVAADQLDANRFVVERGEVTEILHFDADGETAHIERVQDVEDILEWCKGRYNDGLANRLCEYRHVGSFPEVVLQIWGKRRGIADPAWFLKREYDHLFKEVLADRDLSLFRTLPGQYH